MGEDLVQDRVLQVRPDGARHPGRPRRTRDSVCSGRPRPSRLLNLPRRYGAAQRPVRAPRIPRPGSRESRGPPCGAERGGSHRPLHPGATVRDRRDAGHVLRRHGHCDLRRRPAVVGDDGHRVRPAEEPRHLLMGRDRCGQAHTLRRALQEVIEPLQGEGQVRAALGAGEGVDLIDDDGLHRAQRLARGAGEHEVQRLRRRNEDLRRVLAQPTALPRGRVPRTHPHRDREGRADGGDPRQWSAQVALDVGPQRLER